MTEARKLMLPVALAAISILGAACAKKKVAAAPPPAPQPAAVAPTSTPTPQQPVRAESRPTPAPVTTPTQRRTPDAATRARIDELLAKIEDAYFDYDKHALRPDAVKALEADSTELRNILKDYPDYKLTIEGHCDERGSTEYNLALGQRRANAVKQYLVSLGVNGDTLTTTSWGKEKPFCTQSSEECYAQNRRGHFTLAR